MKARAQKQTQPQRDALFHHNLRLRHASAKQVERGAPRVNVEGREVGPGAFAPTLFAHDFSRTPAYATAPLSLQAKLMVNTPGDSYEQQADLIADQVMQISKTTAAPTHVQRLCSGCEADKKEREDDPTLRKTLGKGDEDDEMLALLLPARAAGSVDSGPAREEKVAKRGVGILRKRSAPETTDESEASIAPPVLQQVLRSGGQPLEHGTRAFMEARFGHDFSRVRVHTDRDAVASATSLQALAYTVGQDIVFGRGQYEPGSERGKRLLAHELTHVIQQGSAAPLRQIAFGTQTATQVEQQGEGSSDMQARAVAPTRSSAEREAQSVSNAVAEGRPLPGPVSAQSSGMVQRSLFGDIAGTLIGVGVGAGLGFLIGGPIGAVVGGILGGVAGFAIARLLSGGISTSVAEDGVPSHALGACSWGLTFPETVDETVVAVKSGATWKADPTALKGHYSKQTRLLPGQTEVTGPSGNTTAANYCAQVGELGRLGDCPGGAWYMLSAVVAHENVHAAHFNPALKAAAPNIKTDFNAVTVPDAPGKTAATALTELKALPAYATAKGNMQPRWLTQVLALAANDHNGPAAAAEHKIVDPMIKNICNHAKANKWAACADCPP
jgi:hypothetical protein